jgi:hypothetical protein
MIIYQDSDSKYHQDGTNRDMVQVSQSEHLQNGKGIHYRDGMGVGAAGGRHLTSPAQYFCLLRVTSYTSSFLFKTSFNYFTFFSFVLTPNSRL